MEAIKKNRVNIGMILAAAAFLGGLLMVAASPGTGLKAIAAVIAAALVFINPMWGIFLNILAIPFLTNETIIVFTALVVLSYILRVIIKKENRFKSTPLDMPILVFLLIEVLTTITSVSPIQSAKNLAVELVSFSFFFTIVNTIDTKEKLDKTIKIFIIIAVAMSLLGIYQSFTMGTTDRAWTDVSENPGLKTRVVATFGNPNVFAEYLEHILPPVIALFFAYRRRANKLITAGAALTMTVALVLTFSRGAWLGFAGAMFLFFLLMYAKYIPLLLAGGIAALPFMPGVVLQRIQTIGSLKDSSNAYRVYIWEGALNMIKDFWVTGVGFGFWAFKNTFLEYAIGGRRAWHAHNMYLEILAEMGIFGILVFAWVILMLFKSTIGFIKTTKDKYLSYLSAGLLCSVFAIMIHGIAEHILYLPKSILMFWMFAAFIMAARNIGCSDSTQSAAVEQWTPERKRSINK